MIIKKIYFMLLSLLLFILPASLSEAADAHLSDSDGKTGVNISIDSKADVYVAVYDKAGILKSVNAFENSEGDFTCTAEGFEKGSDMTVKCYVWSENLVPLTAPLIASYTNSILGSGIVFEAEDIVMNSNFVVADTDASNGKTVRFSSHRWNLSDTKSDDMYAEFYSNSSEENVRYTMWMRCYTESTQTASIYQDLNKGSFAAKYFTSTVDYVYRWTKSDIYLNPGINHIAFRWRGPSRIDKFIITSNVNYTPEGFGYLPPVLTEEDMEKEWATLWAEPEIKPIEGHPRLYITKDSINEFKEKLTKSDLSWRYDKYKRFASETLNCRLDTSLSKNHNGTLLTKIMARALVWVLGDETDISHAKQTVSYMRDYLDTVRTPDDEGDITRIRGDIMVAAAVVYDWCYDALSDDDKKYFIYQFKKIASSKEIGWPPVNMSSVASHGGEQEIFRDLLSAGVAIYDEYPLMYNLAAGRFFEEMLPARLWLRNAGRFDQGNDYAECRYYSEVWADAIYQAMGYPSVYGNIEAKNLHWLIRSRLSYGAMMPSGDMYSITHSNYENYYANYVLSWAIAANLYGDPYVNQEFRRRFALGNYGEDVQFWYTVFANPDTECKVWDDLNPGFVSSYPLSGAMARTSWQEGKNSDNAMAFMNMHEIFVGDHQNIYTGDFQLYYKGLLAMNTGTYNASTQHNEGYKRRAIAGNTMLCYDPDEKFVPTWSNSLVPNDGGQRTPYVENGVSKGSCIKELSEFSLDANGKVTNEDLIVAKDVRTYQGPNASTPSFTYVGGDLANAYSDKVSFYERHMVFMDLYDEEIPAAFVVYDKMISKDASFKKTWLIHSMQKPEAKSSSFTILRNENGFNGKLETEILLPENPEVTVVGGDNNEMFTVGGLLMKPKENTIEGGKYRLEVSPSVASKEDVFLHAMYMTDADSEASLEMTKFETDMFSGVHIADRLVLFAKDKINSDFTLDTTSFDGETLVFISGLDSKGIENCGKTYAVENGCVVLKLSEGMHTLVPSEKSGEVLRMPDAKRKPIGDFFIWHTTDGSARGNGYYVYLEKPTRLIDGKAYVSVETLREFGAEVNSDGKYFVVRAQDRTDTLIPGVNCKSIDGDIYVNPGELSSLSGYKFSYSAVSNVLKATKQ